MVPLLMLWELQTLQILAACSTASFPRVCPSLFIVGPHLALSVALRRWSIQGCRYCSSDGNSAGEKLVFISHTGRPGDRRLVWELFRGKRERDREGKRKNNIGPGC